MSRDFARRHWLSTLAIAAGLLAATACGGGMGTRPATVATSSTGTAKTQLKIGDAAADRIVAFEVTIASPITVNTASGSVQIQLGSNRVELSHMSAELEPLTLLDVPQGTYTGATLTVSHPEVTFVDNTGGLHTFETSGSQTVNVTFSPAITIGSAATVLSLDVNLANSVITDASGAVSGVNFTASSFTFTTHAVSTAKQEDDDGELENVNGLVSNVSGSNFTINVGQSGAQLTFATDNTTEFKDGVAGLSTLLNQIVKVEGITKADGTLFASEVEGMENENGAELEGVMTSVNGNPATSLMVLSQDGTGNGMDATKVGAAFTANVSGAQYKVDLGNVDTSGLGGIPSTPNFPFDASTVKPGQRVEIESSSGVPVPGGTVNAEKVKLQQQALQGTVTNFAAGSGGASTFDLGLPADSYLTLLSGQSSVHVFVQPGTDNKMGTISNGSKVRVRGLLFWTGSSFNLIARRITP